MPETETTDRAGSAGKGLRWGLVARVAARLASFGMGLVLARLLAPADFGIYAVALAAQQFLWHVNDAGIVAAIVQWRGRIEEVLPTATTMVLTFSLTVYAVLWVAAPTFAGFAGNADAAGMVRVMALLIVIDGFVGVRSAVLLRRFQQGRIAIATMIGVAVQVPVAVGFAMAGAGPYSFAFGALASTGVGGVLMIIWSKAPIRFGLRREAMGRLLRFGMPLALGLGVEALLLNADSVIVGQAFGAAVLGYYLLALNVSNWVPGLIGEALRHVTLPGFSRVADERPEDLSAKVQQIIPLLTIVITPVAVLVAVLAPVVVPLLYGEKWLPSAAALSFLMVLMAVRMFMNTCSDVLTSVGAVGSIAMLKISWAVVLLPALYFGAQLDGIRGVAIAHAVVGVVVTLPLTALLLRRAGVALGPIGPAVVRPLLGGLAAGVVTWLVMSATADAFSLVRLIAAGGAGLVAYVVVGISPARLREIRTLVTS
ncbi:oligosaccharide flippase family protein [Nonomuraea africana]|uniref:PST family polysaccharide transporter n=1 Tax=Nonomuraea africana TaxID=46171 RepID=A0ABR9KSJ4_9ACTN|nr:oligosaccharide flippase family protein [Nonomuraea africana]MBE1565013.1 PST family polysaccharide transporter [Nonomuraea africana]